MTQDLFLMPVNDQWLPEFKRTVKSGIDGAALDVDSDFIPLEEPVHVWGTRAGEGNRATFEQMQTDDIVLFYREGIFFAAAEIVETEESPELGAAIWDNEESRFVYTLKNVRGIDLAKPELWQKLGYADDFTLRGLMRVDPDRLSGFVEDADDLSEVLERYESHQALFDHPTKGEEYDPYWEMVMTKRDLVKRFLDDPTRERFEELVDPSHFWGSHAYRAWYDDLLDRVGPEDIRDILQDAVETGSIQDLLELHQVRAAKATELLRAIEPNEFAILNGKSREAMEALGYDVPGDRPSDVEYERFTEDVREAYREYDLRKVVEDTDEGSIHPDAEPLEIADAAFHYHVDGYLDLTEIIPEAPLDRLRQLLDDEPWQPAIYRRASAHLVAGKNVVFYGPPGTGKTRAARRLSDCLCQQTSLVTANAEWSNHQVVGGYHPDEETWKAKPGFLTEAAIDCRRSLESSNPRPSWLIIDELNRANLDEAFGDVFTLLDLDYRTTERLTYADESIAAPLSFRILATMNTYDQAQLFSLGYAFRRRFAFVRVPSLLESPDQSLEIESPIPSASPELDTSAAELVDLIKRAAIESMCRGAEGEGVSERDVATIFPEFSNEKTLKTALETIENESDLQTDGLTPTETLVYFCREVTDRGIVDIGQALLIDTIKYLIAHQLLFPEKTSRSMLDDAVVSYVVPQFEHFMSELRRAETINQGSDAGQRFDQIIQLAQDLSLPRTAVVLKEAKETKQLLS